MTVLHLVRKLHGEYAFRIAEEYAGDESVGLRVVYLQDGVYLPRCAGSSGRHKEYVLKEDLEARSLTDERTAISYGELVDLIFDSDRVVTW